MHDFLTVLPTVAGSPLALSAYVILIVAWAVVSLTFRRTNALFRSIEHLPESQRLKAIQLEYRTVPKDGLTSEQWLASKRLTFVLIVCGATLITLITIAGMSFHLLLAQGRERASSPIILFRADQDSLIDAQGADITVKGAIPQIGLAQHHSTIKLGKDFKLNAADPYKLP